MKFPSAFLLCFLYLPFSALSQQLTQTVKGSVVDRDTRQPLIGAEITILYSPLDPVRSLEEERFVPRAGAEWSEQVDPYLRLDSRIAFRKARTKYAYIVSLDIQNLTNRFNPHSVGYDLATNSLTFGRHTGGLIPVLSYQMDF